MTSSTRHSLARIDHHLDESLGHRTSEIRPRLSPALHPKDTGRRPLRNFGQLDIEQIIPDPTQPREQFEPEALERLAQSIREKGQLSPIRVRWNEEHEKWMIIAGERRWRAARQAGLTAIECCFCETELSASEVREQQLVENLLREDLSPLEEAKAFDALMQLNGWNGKQLAQALRIDPSKVSRSLALLRLPDEVQAGLDAGNLSARSAYEIGKLDDPHSQRELARQATSGRLTYQQAASAVRKRKGKSRPAPRGTHRVFVAENGYKVTVTSPSRGTYDDMRQALQWALDEVDHCLANRVRYF